MSLHLSHSTTYSDTNAPALPNSERFGDWQSAGTAVEFSFKGRYSSIAPATSSLSKQLNPEIGNLPIIDPQSDRTSGRYRQKIAVPI